MCLTTIKKTYQPPLKVKKPKIAYKLMYECPNGFFVPPFISKGIGVELGWWCEDNIEETLYADSPKWYNKHKQYRTGFHVFKTIRGARKFKALHEYYFKVDVKIIKVAIDNITAVGKQDDIKVIVARNMRLIEKCA